MHKSQKTPRTQSTAAEKETSLLRLNLPRETAHALKKQAEARKMTLADYIVSICSEGACTYERKKTVRAKSLSLA